ncbi:MAG: 16S rRNA (cytosine(967)-C(5))-methyltransferase RsmB [Oscillospiraceae bacterium]
MNERKAALAALERYRRSGEFSESALDRVITSGGLDTREAALCTRIVYCVLQNTALLDHCIASYSTVPPKRLEPKVLDILRLSAAQLLFMDRIPKSAAVDEGVALCKTSDSKRASGLVNAVLRRISENAASLPPIPGEGTAGYLATKYSHPLWLAELLLAERGYDFTEAFFAANNTEPPICAVVNTLKTDAESLSLLLTERGAKVAHGQLSDCLLLQEVGRLTSLPEFLSGLFYIQDEAARRAVLESGAASGMNVLDACAAPGGKSFAAAIQMKNSGRIIACDIGTKKLTKISEGAARLGIDCIEARTMDARTPDADLINFADVVLADCPCSGMGVIRKKPEIRYKSEQELLPLPEIQRAILSGLAPCVKPGGVLLYSTCTVLKRENEDVVAAFLDTNPDFSAEKMQTYWPQIHGTDGFFICKLIKST